MVGLTLQAIAHSKIYNKFFGCTSLRPHGLKSYIQVAAGIRPALAYTAYKTTFAEYSNAMVVVSLTNEDFSENQDILKKKLR